MATATPVSATQRIDALDVLRGLAIFGILVVNLEQMFLPLFLASDPVPMLPDEAGAGLAWFVTDALFENKFLTLFSLLFGIGFGLQWQRYYEKRGKFRYRYLRRIAVLLLIGLVHGLFFYRADVLMLYALVAMGLLLLAPLKQRTMAILGATLLLLMMAWGTVSSGPGEGSASLPERQREVAAEIASIRQTGAVYLPAGEYPAPRMLDGPPVRVTNEAYSLPLPPVLAMALIDGAPDEVVAKVEYAVMSQGPNSAAVFNRLSFLAPLLILYTPFYLGWRTLGLFLLGAALARSGWLQAGGRTWRRWSVIGLGIGIPMTLWASWLRWLAWRSPGVLTYAGHVLHDVSSLLLVVGLSSAVLTWCSAGLHTHLQRGIAAVGRTALSNYLGQSVVMSLLATSYGLGLYGDLTRIQLLLVAVICFSLQLLISSWWLRNFAIGPLEWIWRCATYLRWLPLRA